VHYRRLIIIGHDLIMTAVAVLFSFFLRWGTVEFWNRLDEIALATLMVMPAAAGAFWVFRLHTSPWKFVSISDLTKIGSAVCIPAVLLVLIDFMTAGAVLVPRTVPIIYWFVQVFLLAGPRMLYRAYRNRRRERKAFQGVYRMPVLIAGTGDEVEQLIRRLQRDTVSAMEPVGLLASKARHVGERIQNVPILGLLSELEGVLQTLESRGIKPRRLIVARESLTLGPVIDDLLGTARRLNLPTVRSSSSLTDVDRPQGPLQLAPVSIDDLLGRSTRDMDLTPVRDFIAARKVMVTGAGGSIGSELCRQIAAMQPSELMIFDHSEFALYTISNELRQLSPPLAVAPRLGNVADREDVFRAFRDFRPDLVFHAAALKHVDIVEQHPVAAATTNTIGTRHVADAAFEVDVTCAVFISTDKAVNPVSILGATKRAGELYWAAADRMCREMGRPNRFIAVRFGNVLGSSGSVIPLFTEQLKRGGPMTVTHPEVERYFMTMSEAVRLVLMTSALGVKDDMSSIFVLDMGEPIKIVELARRMIRLAGLEPDREVDIVFTGLRPGERLREALEHRDEDLRQTAIPGVRATETGAMDLRTFKARFGALEQAVTLRKPDLLMQALLALVPEYRPEESGPHEPEYVGVEAVRRLA
jgi:FlaA1/EpsC-like NDP-sugar epimerase